MISESLENEVENWLVLNASKDRPALPLRVAQALKAELPEVNACLRSLNVQERVVCEVRKGVGFYHVPKASKAEAFPAITEDVPDPKDYAEDDGESQEDDGKTSPMSKDPAPEGTNSARESKDWRKRRAPPSPDSDRMKRAQGAQGRAPAKQKGYGNRQPCRHCGRMLDGRGKNAHEFACGRKAKAAPPSNASVEVPEAPLAEVTAGIEAKDSADRLIERIQLCARTVKEMRRLAVEAGLRVEFEANNGYLSLDIYWKEVSS